MTHEPMEMYQGTIILQIPFVSNQRTMYLPLYIGHYL
jgi:hypothetical protein